MTKSGKESSTNIMALRIFIGMVQRYGEETKQTPLQSNCREKTYAWSAPFEGAIKSC